MQLKYTISGKKLFIKFHFILLFISSNYGSVPYTTLSDTYMYINYIIKRMRLIISHYCSKIIYNCTFRIYLPNKKKNKF